jgi:2-keto-4-pentenoate hydratase/2-oxohepta-3-ene-1,7-dioic acid hydratase in catechol pathway
MMFRSFILTSAAIVALATSATAQTVTKYVRYQAGNTTSYGILEGDAIRELQGSIFDGAKPTGRTRKLAEVKLLAPVEPRKVIAAGLNYKSHIGEQPAAKYVGLFAKLPSSIIGQDDNIIYPADATDLHYEAEIVVVIGRRASNITEAQVPQYIFGVTAGNDVSERAWQKQDMQWFRAKASDTFGPMGPALVTGLDYNNLNLIGRHNGKVVQETNTKLLIFSIPYIVSYVSRYVTLEPGDVIFTGTPGVTQAMKPGDTFEVEVQGVGVLRNKIVAASQATRSGQ